VGDLLFTLCSLTLLPFSLSGERSEPAKYFWDFGHAAARAAMPKVARVAEARVAGRVVDQ
jgi:hypothetical protein